MEEVKIKRYKGSLLLKVAVFCFACFMVTMLVGQQISISQKKDELQQLKNELKEQQVVNDELRYDLNEENADNRLCGEGGTPRTGLCKARRACVLQCRRQQLTNLKSRRKIRGYAGNKA